MEVTTDDNENSQVQKLVQKPEPTEEFENLDINAIETTTFSAIIKLTSNDEFIADTGANHHCLHSKYAGPNFRSEDMICRGATGNPFVTPLKIGTIRIKTRKGILPLQDCRTSAKFTRNLVSIGKLLDSGWDSSAMTTKVLQLTHPSYGTLSIHCDVSSDGLWHLQGKFPS